MAAVRDVLTEALQMAIPDVAAEEIELLKSIKDEGLKRNVFICLIYRMEPERLKEMLANNASSDDVIQERNAYLVSLASDQDPVIQKAEKALERSEKLKREQEGIKEYLKNELSQALEMAKTSGERERNALLEQVAILKDQLANEKKQYADLEEKAKETDRRLQESLSRISEYESQVKELQQNQNVFSQLYVENMLKLQIKLLQVVIQDIIKVLIQ